MSGRNGSIKYITLKVPVYTGEVSNTHPARIEPSVQFKLLQSQQTEILNRIYYAFMRKNPVQIGEVSHSQVLRHVVLDALHEAYQKQVK